MDDLFARPVAMPQPERPPASSIDADGRLDLRCELCGAMAHFGFGVSLRKNKIGRWACEAHRDDVKSGVRAA